jgi:hypothetical protein
MTGAANFCTRIKIIINHQHTWQHFCMDPSYTTIQSTLQLINLIITAA